MYVSIKDIQQELGCKVDRAREIMLMELPHIDIRSPGAKRATWRAKRRDFDRWQNQRTNRPGKERIEEFSRRYMR